MHNNINNHAYKQTGATLLGMLIVGAALFFVAIIAMKMAPAYQEYFSVKTTLRTMNKEGLNNMSKEEIRTNFNKRASAGYIDVIKGSDLTIGKNSAGDTVVSTQYNVIKPLFGNVSALINFETPADGK